MRILLLVAVGLGLSACAVRMRGGHPPHPPPPPPPPPPIEVRHGVSRDDAIAIAMNVAAQRQLGAQPKEVERDDGKWEVELAVWRGHRRGEMEVHIDARSGEVLKVKEELNKRDDDDDDDD